MTEKTVKIIVGNLDNNPVINNLSHKSANDCVESARRHGLKVSPIDGGFHIVKRGTK